MRSDIRPHGLHHVTAIASDPQRNVDFYTRVLGVTMSERLLDPTAQMLAGMLGMQLGGEDAGRARFAMASGGPGAVVDVAAGDKPRGLQAGGTVHHIAFRAPDGKTQARWRQELVDAGVQVTEIIDRQYVTSIYFRKPGGVLLEIATDRPGFTVDEALLELGRSLKLPPWLEPSREQIAAGLPRCATRTSTAPTPDPAANASRPSWLASRRTSSISGSSGANAATSC